MRKTHASDAIAWKSCRRRAWYDLSEMDVDVAPDAFDQLIKHAGMKHEHEVLAKIGEYSTAHDESHTQALMAASTPIIYQPRFADEDLGVVAQPDFLLLESKGYRAADAKLARSIDKKADLRIQLAVYQLALGTELGTKALLGDGTTAEISTKDLGKAVKFLDDMKKLRSSNRPGANYSATRCSTCPHRKICVPEFQVSGDLGQNYFIDARAIPKLEAFGVSSLQDLANHDANLLPDVPYFNGVKKHKAVLHAQALLSQTVSPLAPTIAIEGTPIHFDIETDPLAAESAEEVYLWGFLPPPYGKSHFEYVWHDGGAKADHQGWKHFLQVIAEHRATYPDVVYVHYARFERDVIKRYAEKFGDNEHPTVDWLLNGGGLMDIRENVVSSLVLPTYGYGLKEICKHEGLVNFQWELEESGSQWSVVRYHDFLAEQNAEEREAIKQEILSYNRDDVRATRALEVWLDELR